MPERLSARAAAEILGVSLATLYAYVSRGLLEASAPGAGRRKSYGRDQVLQLAARRADAKRAGHVATAAMSWGMPVLETSVSGIVNGQLRYRGRDPLQLAERASLEQTAALLWGLPPQANAFERWLPCWPQAQLMPVLQALSEQPPLERAKAMLPLYAALTEASACSDEPLAQAVDLMRVLAALLLARPPSLQPLHLQVAQAWGLGELDAELIRAALVLLADHELNASTFALRCVAATGASLAASLGAALAALSGPQHGGGSLAVRQLLDSALARLDPSQALADHGDALPGLGHPLYADGDPRGRLLLTLLARTSGTCLRSQRVLAIGQAAASRSGRAPNADWALGALGAARRWPLHAGSVLFALGRSAGWIAHAREQQAQGSLIRPRARYIGPLGA
ncbi:citrate synthase family protein [Paucibacter sp. APW11]|uniref:citrate synthase (unknown stereospecificity) n=1 Tax=Roseateles aquae TaxID=3077235 RepID=A0ABU3PHJ4_9BURK|nr:citrate synthase family protein [Paucibacter sp. APW11]MDT9002027.1 citrate synthase family protein [Paucibacter sp. APW11]